MKMIIVLITLIIQSMALEWCQKDERIIQCYDDEEFQKEFIEKNKECQQDIFVIDENTLVFQDNIKVGDVEIQCEHHHEYDFAYMPIQRNDNGTLKGMGGIDNCAVSECNGYCYQCEKGYYLNSYHKGWENNGGSQYYCKGYRYCKKCAAGKSTDGFDTECSACSKGYYTPGGTACKKCPAGRYGASTGLGECTKCPAGTYNENTGSTSSAACLKCNAGYTSSAGSKASTACTKCAAGKYNADKGSTCKNCAAGSYSSAQGATKCTTCPVGTSVFLTQIKTHLRKNLLDFLQKI